MDRNGYSTRGTVLSFRARDLFPRWLFTRSNPPTAGFVGTVDKSVHPREKVNGWCSPPQGEDSIQPYREIILPPLLPLLLLHLSKFRPVSFYDNIDLLMRVIRDLFWNTALLVFFSLVQSVDSIYKRRS